MSVPSFQVVSADMTQRRWCERLLTKEGLRNAKMFHVSETSLEHTTLDFLFFVFPLSKEHLRLMESIHNSLYRPKVIAILPESSQKTISPDLLSHMDKHFFQPLDLEDFFSQIHAIIDINEEKVPSLTSLEEIRTQVDLFSMGKENHLSQDSALIANLIADAALLAGEELREILNSSDQLPQEIDSAFLSYEMFTGEQLLPVRIDSSEIKTEPLPPQKAPKETTSQQEEERNFRFEKPKESSLPSLKVEKFDHKKPTVAPKTKASTNEFKRETDYSIPSVPEPPTRTPSVHFETADFTEVLGEGKNSTEEAEEEIVLLTQSKSYPALPAGPSESELQRVSIEEPLSVDISESTQLNLHLESSEMHPISFTHEFEKGESSYEAPYSSTDKINPVLQAPSWQEPVSLATDPKPPIQSVRVEEKASTREDSRNKEPRLQNIQPITSNDMLSSSDMDFDHFFQKPKSSAKYWIGGIVVFFVIVLLLLLPKFFSSPDPSEKKELVSNEKNPSEKILASSKEKPLPDAGTNTQVPEKSNLPEPPPVAKKITQPIANKRSPKTSKRISPNNTTPKKPNKTSPNEFLLAKKDFAKGRLARARKRLERLQQKKSNDVDVLVLLGKTYYELEAVAKARKVLTQAYQISPRKMKDGLIILASIYREKQQRIQAKKYYQMYLKYFPSGKRTAEVRKILKSL